MSPRDEHDAIRYQWLRDHPLIFGLLLGASGPDFDARLDAAIEHEVAQFERVTRCAAVEITPEEETAAEESYFTDLK